MASSEPTTSIEASMDANADGEVAATLVKAQEASSDLVDPVVEEKKSAGPGEDDGEVVVGSAGVVEVPKSVVTGSQQEAAPVPSTMSPESGMVSPTSEAPKQTLSGQAALHSTGSSSAKPAKEKSKDKKSSSGDSPLSPGSNQANNDDEDSSNDDSSYFADPNNLPSPGEAGRKYSYSSNHSMTKGRGGRESDASLSLSEDSDDDTNHNNNNLYAAQQAPEVFPQQRITRMHSVGSLVSTSSQNTEDDAAVRRELRQVGKQRAFDSQNNVPSGRVSPAQGPHQMYPPHHGSSVPHGSPPTIMPDYRQQYHLPQGFPHPQPQMMSQQQQPQDQWAAGHSGGGAPNNGGGWSDGTLQYSEDTGGNGGGRAQNGGGGPGKKSSSRRVARDMKQKIGGGYGEDKTPPSELMHGDGDGFKVYWQRWIMLMYMSVLNLLSDWTCYSVAPIALLTQEAFGDIDPEQLVTIFLAANAVASACEPIILSRLGLRRTVLFGSLLLMIGSMIKSGGMPPIIQANLEKGHCEWQIYLGFFLVGLSQPLYQCTPALLSASWFPERERTMATGVALNANQLGIGFAFIFGTLLVGESDDIPGYFGLLSIVSTVAFFGTLFQFDDAPPTPPSDSARVMRGTLEVNLPSVQTILQSIGVGNNEMKRDIDEAMKDGKSATGSRSSSKRTGASGKTRRSVKSSGSKGSRGSAGPPTSQGRPRRSRNAGPRKPEGGVEPQAPPPSAALYGPVTDIVSAPSPMMPGSVGGGAPTGGEEPEGERRGEQQPPPPIASGYPYGSGAPVYPGSIATGVPAVAPMPPGGYPQASYGPPQGMPAYNPYPPQGYPGYQVGYVDPRYQQYAYPPQQYYPPAQRGSAYSYQHQVPRPDQQMYGDPYSVLPPAEGIDAGAEPVLTITPHHLDIDIRDDQIILATRACFARPGFIHSLVSFTVSGIVINTLSTYMDYLVRLNGAGREYTGIIGGSFQVVIMISSLIIGGLTDKSRAYYSVTIGMLVIGAFGLAECGVSLNADRGSDLRVALIVVAALVGPLQPVSTELGVEVVYPLSENTVLVIQQLFSNLLSALFIPVFKELKDIGISEGESGAEQPEYTFSFYLLIVLHAAATIFFATFNGRYLRYEHELQKKEEKERKRQEAFETASIASMGSFQPSLMSGAEGYETGDSERQPLVQQTQQQIV